MKHPGKLFLMVLLITIVAFNASSAFSSSSQEEGSSLDYGEEEDVSDETHDSSPLEAPEPVTSLRGTGRFLAQATSLRTSLKCNKYPKICRAKGSPGRDCCKKKCVNTYTDRLNCGMCGHKCKYSEICCKGKCVNPMSDRKHCGGCHNKCKRKRSSCVYGMCSYA